MHRPRKADVERYQAAVRAEQERRRPFCSCGWSGETTGPVAAGHRVWHIPTRPAIFTGSAGL